MKSVVATYTTLVTAAILTPLGISNFSEPVIAQTCSQPPTGDLVNLERYYHDDFWAHNRDHYYQASNPNVPAPTAGDTITVQGAQYIFEGIEGQIYENQVPGTVPLYQMHDIGLRRDHFYTTSQQDINDARFWGFQPAAPNQPTIVGYIFPDKEGGYCGATELYRLYNLGAHDHFYTTDSAEQANAQRLGYAPENSPGFILEEGASVAARKNPVVIVGGTWASQVLYWNLRDRLAQDGYFAEVFELPGLGTRDIRDSVNGYLDPITNQPVQGLRDKIQDIIDEYGTDQVHLIGHSQGSLVARTYIDLYRAENRVESMISLAGPNQGTGFVKEDKNLFAEILGCLPPDQVNPANALNNPANPCDQMAIGSTLIQQVNNNRPANDPIFYTNFTTSDDHYVTPRFRGEMLNCTSPECVNIHIQDQSQCPQQALIDHINLPFSGVVYSGILQALAHEIIDLDCDAR